MGSQEIGIILIFAGMIIILVGILYLALGSEGNVEGGAVVIIGPIPIVFGSNKRIAWGLLIAALALTLILIAFYYYASRKIIPS
ncbi:MAG: DUF131 domain-containing protein [Desulfurococcales archaeon]|nr:DUF131 domain-containing protein [Desulfurococcales archaeon]